MVASEVRRSNASAAGFAARRLTADWPREDRLALSFAQNADIFERKLVLNT
jgi:hypothetical protein